MFFCEKCNNFYDISKTAVSKQKGGEVDDMEGGDLYTTIITKLVSDKDLKKDDLKALDLKKLLKHSDFKKLKTKDKEYVYNRIQDLLPKGKKKLFKQLQSDIVDENLQAFFKCTNCGFTKKIESGTKIFSISNEQSNKVIDIDLVNIMKHSDILRMTRRYKCPNDKCVSHKDPVKREAKMYRDSSGGINYICLACNLKF